MNYEKIFHCFCITAAVIYLLHVLKNCTLYWMKCWQENRLLNARKKQDENDYNEKIKKEKEFASARFRHEERMKVIEKTGIIPREIESYFDSPTQATVPATT